MSSTSYPLATVAKILNISERRIQQLVKDGILPKAQRGKYDLVGCVQSYIGYLQERAYGQGAEAKDTQHERARLLKAQADKTELEVAVLRKALLPAEAVEEAWIGVLSAFKARMLSLPTKAAQYVAHLTDPSSVENTLRGMVDEALTELANYGMSEPSDTGSGKTSDSNRKTAAKDGPRGVGGRKKVSKRGSKRGARKVENKQG
ncbi:terminase small subunit, Nu1 [Candidatus Kaiserbacteria bacterium]|nr:terminase small subunit, Nu1 [Candidatus Kaiserbacteria bacterium]